jgi:hypothetical protein
MKKEAKSFSVTIRHLRLFHYIYKVMSNLFYNCIFLALLFITNSVDLTLGSCQADTVGDCGCCNNSTSECIVASSDIISSVPFYEDYICIPKILIRNFSCNQCNCTSKQSTLCISSNQYSKIYPLYPSCYSFTECIM